MLHSIPQSIVEGGAILAPGVFVDHFSGPPNQRAVDRSAGQRTFFSFGDSNAVHFPSPDEERAWRHRHRIHTDRFLDRCRRDRRVYVCWYQGFERDEQRRQHHDLIESVLVPEWAVRQRAAHFFWPRRCIAYQRYTLGVARIGHTARLDSRRVWSTEANSLLRRSRGVTNAGR